MSIVTNNLNLYKHLINTIGVLRQGCYWS